MHARMHARAALSRYRAEAKTVAERSEALVGELRAEAERLTIRNAELSASLQQLTSANGQLERADREKVSTLAVLKKQLTEVRAPPPTLLSLSLSLSLSHHY